MEYRQLTRLFSMFRLVGRRYHFAWERTLHRGNALHTFGWNSVGLGGGSCEPPILLRGVSASRLDNNLL